MVKDIETIGGGEPEYRPEVEAVMAALDQFRSALVGDSLEQWLQLNLSMGQSRVLLAISQLGSRASGRQLARELRITPAAVVQVCDRLEEQGYIARVPDSVDRRVTWFQLTPAGEGAFGAHSAAFRNSMGPALDTLSDGDLREMARILSALGRALRARRRQDAGGRDCPAARPASGVAASAPARPPARAARHGAPQNEEAGVGA
jgi:DNA-binding MarR family transcriptional regulator